MDENRTHGREGEVRAPAPEAAAQDPKNAATQEQIHRDAEASRAQAARANASVPAEVRDRTVHEIVEDAGLRADRHRQ